MAGANIHFTFVSEGQMTLEGEGKDPYWLSAGDAFVIPPNMATRYSDPSDDLELLEVSFHCLAYLSLTVTLQILDQKIKGNVRAGAMPCH